MSRSVDLTVLKSCDLESWYLARGFKNDDVEWRCSKVLSLPKGLRSILMKRLGYSVEMLGRES